MKKTLLSVCAAALATSALATTTLTLNPSVKRTPLASDVFSGPAIAAPANIMKPAPQTRAAEEALSMDFSYAYTPYTAESFGDSGVGYNIWQGFEVPAELATKFAGTTIKSINFYNGINGQTETNTIRTAEVYICSSLDPTPVIEYQQTASLSADAWGYNEIELLDPYTIEEGKGFFIAYSITPNSSNEYYVVFDGLVTDNPYSTLVGVSNGSQYQWLGSEMSQQIGALTISMTIEGDNLPVNSAEIFAVNAETYGLQNGETAVQVIFDNDGANDITDVELQYTVPGAEPVTKTFTLINPVGYHHLLEAEFPITLTEVGDNTIEFKITKVNGVENTSENASASVDILCMDPEVGYPRTYVVEEATGNWCGYCPSGIVFMEWLKANYPETIRVAIHGGSSTEPMAVASAEELLYYYSGFPQVRVNRMLDLSPGNLTNCETAFANFTEYMSEIPSYAEITDLTYSDWTDTSVKATVKVRFAYDRDNAGKRYGISFSVCEDGVGPYMQTNYYAGNRNGKMGGWEKKGSQVATFYDDVLRELAGGVAGYNAFPEEIVTGTEYEFTTEINISKVTSPGFYLNAMVTDNNYGDIVAARQLIVGVPNAVEEIEAENGIVSETWYDLNGMRIETPAGICIKRTTLSDGTVRHEKTIVKK